jgi:hypothetical protein
MTTRVSVAYVHSEEVAYSWFRSLTGLVTWDRAHNRHVVDNEFIDIQYSSGGLAEARNKAVEEFLDKTHSDWLFWLDTDMGFEPDIVDRLLDVADPKERPIVGALAFAFVANEQDGMGGKICHTVPVIFNWYNTEHVRGYQTIGPYPINTLLRCSGLGSACILIHRSVFERMQIELKSRTWYDQIRIINDGKPEWMGEDLSFCSRAGSMDIPIYVNTAVKTTHYKHVWVGERQFWEEWTPEPAEEEVAVLVPVMRRPHNAEPFMRSLRASTGLARAYAIYDREDLETAAAWKAAGAELIDINEFRELDRPGRFSEKVNVGAEQTSEPWVFICGDDVSFHAGWLDSAMSVVRDDVHVIGTNDLGNPRVLMGDHATHILIRRDYIKAPGASWGKPGTIAYEGYHHWFVDDEIVTAAKHRHCWAMALGSIVEHLHPFWGKGKPDKVYELGQDNAEDDKREFERRCNKYLP